MGKLTIGKNIQRIFFIGIGGVHMSGLAELCFLNGYRVSGSDARQSDNTDRLLSLGIRVTIGHDGKNLPGDADLVVYTSAAKSDNPEILRARELGLTVIDRATLLSVVMGNYRYPVCVSGSHGKTTTTTMISEIFLKSRRYNDPTIMNGGICPSINASMRAGNGEHFIAEADEYYDAFLKYRPFVGVILNIDMDHADYFPTFEDLWRSFYRFARLIPKDGALVVNASVTGLEKLIAGIECQVIIVSADEGPEAVWRAGDVAYDDEGCPSFNVMFCKKLLGRVKLAVPGFHNIGNALAALAACGYLGVSFDEAVPALEACVGAVRRFQKKGVFQGLNGPVTVIDDYAHHPTEVTATLSAANQTEGRKKGRLWCVFQPHTRSRTVEFMDEFAKSLALADKVVLLDIFTPSGREEGHINVTSADLAERIASIGGDAVAVGSFDEAKAYLLSQCRVGDTVITMGAGDVYKVGEMLIK